MSVNDEKTKILEEEIVVNEVEETTDLVEMDKEAKKAKMMNTGKKVLKVHKILKNKSSISLSVFGDSQIKKP